MDYLYKEINSLQLLLLKYENNKQLQTTMHTKPVRMFQKRLCYLRQNQINFTEGCYSEIVVPKF